MEHQAPPMRLRKEPTISEKVALAEAIAERLQGRQLANLKQHRSGNISGSDEQGDTRDIAAAKAGLGSGSTDAPRDRGYIVRIWLHGGYMEPGKQNANPEGLA